MRHTPVLCLVILGSGIAFAELVPTFPVSQDARRATHVIVATRTGPGGAIVVSESLKGDLKAGDALTVPFLAIFDDPKERTIIYPTTDPHRGTTLKGDTMYVFLRRAASGEWMSSSPWDGSRPSFVWVEGDRVFGHQRGDGYLTPQPGAICVEYFYGFESKHPPTEADLRRLLATTVAATSSLDAANAIADTAKRAEALAPLVDLKPGDLSSAVFASLAACGEPAVPVLDRILADEDRSFVHFMAVYSLEKIGSAVIDPVLVRVVEHETAFLRSSSRGAVTYDKVLEHEGAIRAVLGALKQRKCATSRDPLRELRRQLVATGLSEMGFRAGGLREECDKVLDALEK